MHRFYVVTRSGSLYLAQQQVDGSWRMFVNEWEPTVLGGQLLPNDVSPVLVLGETVSWEHADGKPDPAGKTSAIIGVFLDWHEAAECRRLWRQFRSRPIVMEAPSCPGSTMTVHSAMLIATAAMGEWTNLKIDGRWRS